MRVLADLCSYLHGFMDGEALLNRDFCEESRKQADGDPDILKMKGTERNPRWDSVPENKDGIWDWILVE